MCYQHSEVCAPGAALAGLVSKLTFEFIQGLVQLVLSHQVASVVAQLNPSTDHNVSYFCHFWSIAVAYLSTVQFSKLRYLQYLDLFVLLCCATLLESLLCRQA